MRRQRNATYGGASYCEPTLFNTYNETDTKQAMDEKQYAAF